jgi:putative zinc finger/helix-turn-helix YgiT family protein
MGTWAKEVTMSTVFCVHCRIEKEPRIEQRQEVFTVKGEDVEISANVAVCSECGNDIFLEGIEEQNFKRAYDLYRREHNLLATAEIQSIRQLYGLSQRALAQLLGLGEVTISRYENGAIQARGHDHFLRLLKEPENVRRLLDESSSELSAQVRENLETRLGKLLSPKEKHSKGQCLAALLDSGDASMSNGYRRFDIERAHQAASFLAANVQHFFISKATKLLWYFDFLAYKSQASSVTGSEYEAALFGPVPCDYELLFAEMVASGVLFAEEVLFEKKDGSSGGGKLYRSSEEPCLDLLSVLERKCLEAVAAEFRNLTANQTVDRTHKEEAYLRVFEKGKSWKTIPYELSSTLSLPSIV